MNEKSNRFNEDKKLYDSQKNKIMNDIEVVRQNFIMITSKNSIYTDKLNSLLKILPDLKARKSYLLNECNVSTLISKADMNYRKNLNNIGAYSYPSFNTYMNVNQTKIRRKARSRSSTDLYRNKKFVKRDNLIFELKTERNRIITLSNHLEQIDENQ